MYLSALTPDMDPLKSLLDSNWDLCVSFMIRSVFCVKASSFMSYDTSSHTPYTDLFFFFFLHLIDKIVFTIM